MTTPPEAAADNVVSLNDALEKRRAKGTAPTLDVLFRDDLKKSGITPQHAHKLQLKTAGPDELWKLLHPKNPERPGDFTAGGYVIPYFLPTGKLMPYLRVRKLRGKFSKNDEGQRYTNPTNSLPHIYLPVPLCDWLPAGGAKIKVDRLVIVEGEKKSATACMAGIPCIALGGVDNYKSAKHGILLLEEFHEWFDFTETDLEICYDSDAYNNPSVNHALRAISDVLRRDMRPQSLKQVRLTNENTKGKAGLDDFICQFDTYEKARREYEKLQRVENPISEAFETFNREIAHVKKQTRYFNIAHGTWYPSQKQVTEEYALGTPILDDKGKPVYPISKWFNERSAAVTEVHDVLYTPGKPERYEVDGNIILNTWRRGPLVPTPFKRLHQVAPFFEFLDYLTSSLTKDERAAFLNWTAYPIQNPGKKVMWAMLIWSKLQGVGKNTYARIMREIYGQSNTQDLEGSGLSSTYTDWVEHQLIIVNEVRLPSYNERAAAMERIKTLITDEVIDLNRKFLPRANIPNHANFYLNSNHFDAVLLDEEDRRFFVIHGPETLWPDVKFKEFNAWLESGGYEKIYGYLLKRDLRNFNPKSAAPRTAARAEMIAGRSSPIDDIIKVLIETPARVLCMQDVTGRYINPECDLYLPDQLIECLQRLAGERNQKVTISRGALGGALSRNKVVKRYMDFKSNNQRFTLTAYAMFNADRWDKAETREWRAYIVKHSQGLLK